MKQEFLARMQELLQEEYPAFEKSLELAMYRGVRRNPLKISEETLQALFPYELKQTPFCPDSYYLQESMTSIGNHPLHCAGAIYMQEPSASSAVEVLDVKKGDWVLDLCAAPGGKSTQIAGKLQHTGLLVCNEIEAKRAAVLLSNMERLGIGEAIITNAHPQLLCETCVGWFDKVLVDAPCSGEGMMKKHDAAMDEWSKEHVQACANRQLQILDTALEALKEGGILVYSTCTYAMEENEDMVRRILAQRDDLEQINCAVSFGRIGFACEGMDHTMVRRIFPMDQGEGHFIAKFRKISKGNTKKIKEKKITSLTKELRVQLEDIVSLPKGFLDCVNDKLYFRTQPFLDLGKVKVLRQGILCGEIVKKRIEPHQHLFVSALLKDRFHRVCEMDEETWKQFQSGAQLPIQAYRGYTAMAWNSLIVGFGKGDGICIKNKYPKGLRRKI